MVQFACGVPCAGHSAAGGTWARKPSPTHEKPCDNQYRKLRSTQPTCDCRQKRGQQNLHPRAANHYTSRRREHRRYAHDQDPGMGVVLHSVDGPDEAPHQQGQTTNAKVNRAICGATFTLPLWSPI
jgi:hypothetical protein